jgi:hypothetical protein
MRASPVVSQLEFQVQVHQDSINDILALATKGSQAQTASSASVLSGSSDQDGGSQLSSSRGETPSLSEDARKLLEASQEKLKIAKSRLQDVKAMICLAISPRGNPSLIENAGLTVKHLERFQQPTFTDVRSHSTGEEAAALQALSRHEVAKLKSRSNVKALMTREDAARHLYDAQERAAIKTAKVIVFCDLAVRYQGQVYSNNVRWLFIRKRVCNY